LKRIKISKKWLLHKFPCSVDYIKNVCHGRCCQGTGRILVSLLPEEQEYHRKMGKKVEKGLLQANIRCVCPYKRVDGLCDIHYINKPFGCVVSPFKINSNNTLIMRHRYTKLKCHGTGEPAYKKFRNSLDLLFDESEGKSICDRIEENCTNIHAYIDDEVYNELKYLEGVKHGIY
tara:strand:+ start:194 stop:718 length:525 start_codon:yes stop_codon:yes gene_type:complete